MAPYGHEVTVLLYSKTVKCRKLLILLSQIPRQRMAGGSQVSDTRLVLKFAERVVIINSSLVLKSNS